MNIYAVVLIWHKSAETYALRMRCRVDVPVWIHGRGEGHQETAAAVHHEEEEASVVVPV